MKFGKLLRATVDSRMPQWRDFVVQYKTMKQTMKQAQQQLTATQGASAAEASTTFTALLDQEVEKVNDFYMDRIEEGVIILHALKQHAEQMMVSGASAEQRQACQRSLVSFHFNLLMLQNYVALNFTAVVKILKKCDKKLGVNMRAEYIGSIVELPFYRCQALGQLVEDTERQFKVLEAATATGQMTHLLKQPAHQQSNVAIPMCAD